ncbi:unnamed protein product [Amoebophrya sp. A120]|nr:unnamed protein product [Amoebophrya sp. A120]|eukprot:GSA120T00009541001.1
MFVYLSKKIAIPHNLNLQVIAWNLSQGWIACGGERGLLKVIKLETPSANSSSSSSNLSMNQTLEGHQGTIINCTWNENFRKLTTSDQNGLIIVWMLHRGIWFEEMINNRNRSTVKDMKWTSDGQKICIIYEDGAVIVGTVDGQRLWGKELKSQLAMVEWAPDGRNILFGTPNGEIHLYDPEGVYVLKLPCYCLDQGTEGQIPLAGLHWYSSYSYSNNGANGTTTAVSSAAAQASVPSTQPTLCCAYENGRVQILRHEADDRPVLIDTQMRCTGARWNPSGTVVALAGMQGNNEVGVVQFYSANQGEHLRTLRLPGNNLRSLSWEGSGLRLALAVDYHIFFANVRPDYVWDYFGKTLVYSSYKKERSEYVVVFWNIPSSGSGSGADGSTTGNTGAITGGVGTGTGGAAAATSGGGANAASSTNSLAQANAQLNSGIQVKYMKNVQAIKSCNDHCVIVTKTTHLDDNLSKGGAGGGPQQNTQLTSYSILLCNEIGTVMEKKEVKFQTAIKGVSMTKTHVVVCSQDAVYLWSWNRDSNKKGAAATSAKKAEMMFHIQDDAHFVEKDEFAHGALDQGQIQDGIACVTASDTTLLIGRESGLVQKYALPFLQKDGRFTIKINPQIFQLNVSSTKLLVVDINGILSLYDVDKRKGQVTQLEFERKDVWDVKWASDNPDLFCFMEKQRMYVVRGSQPEEPVLSNGYICEFKDLEIRSALVDELVRNPDTVPQKSTIIMDFETKSLRDTRDILTKLSNLKDAFQYVEDNPHPRLWRLLAENALELLEFQVAEKAFVKFEDYSGIQFVKRLKLLSDKVKQKAEVSTYFQKFDEAEALYREIDRRDLAIDLRLKLGDWFRVIQLVQGTNQNENLLQEAYSSIGDYYADRSKWSHAAQYYNKARNYSSLVEAYYALEDYDSLQKFIPTLPEGDPLLKNIAEKLISVGLCDYGVKAYLRLNDVKSAIDACVLLNEWPLAVELAKKENLSEVEDLLAKYAQYFLEKNDMANKIEAVQLYRKANKFTEAAKWLMTLADEIKASSMQKNPSKMKKIYLLAGLELEKKKDKAVGNREEQAKKIRTSADNFSALTAMMDVDGEIAVEDTSYLQPFRYAEAYHLLMLCQKQIYEHQLEKALRTAIRLTDYEDVLDTKTVYCLVALTAFQSKYFLQCSRAFMKLRKCDPKKFEALALQIFRVQAPRDPSSRMVSCPACNVPMHDWMIQCPSCSHKLAFCVASGRSIFPNQPGGALGVDEVIDCKTCHRKAYGAEARGRISCAFCHTRSTAVYGGGSGGAGQQMGQMQYGGMYGGGGAQQMKFTTS